MCLIVSIVFFVAAYNFYEQGLYIQAIIGTFIGLIIISFFTYPIVKNRRCFFAGKNDCNDNKEENTHNK